MAGNTTLVVLATDARLDLGTLQQTASTAHDGLARTIDPVHTLADGDAVFALASGDVEIPGDADRFRQPGCGAIRSSACKPQPPA